MALQRMRLFILDYAPAFKDEVTHLFSRLNRYERAQRLSISQNENINDISMALLELLRSVKDCSGELRIPSIDRSVRAIEVEKRILVDANDANLASLDTNQLRRNILREVSTVSGLNPSIVATNVTKSLGDGRFLLGPVSLKLKAGQIGVVCGDNGSGKTTLLRLLTGNLLPSSGTIKYFGFEPPNDWLSIKSQIAFVSSDHLISQSSVRQTLEFVAAACGKLRKVNRQAVDDYLARYNLEEVSDKGWSDLSDGFLMRVDLIRCLLTSPRVIVLDEPLAHLDFPARSTLLSELCELAATLSVPTSILLSTHHLEEADLVADQIVVLHRGRCEFAGTKEELRAGLGGSAFHILGDAISIVPARFGAIEGVGRVTSILGGVQLTFDERISIKDLLGRMASVDLSGVQTITDVSVSAKRILLGRETSRSMAPHA